MFGGVGSGPSVTSGLVGWNRLLALPALLFLAVLLAVWSPLAWLGLAWLALHRIAPVLSRLSACWPASGLVALEWHGREELVLLPLFFCPASCCTLAPFRGETRD